MPQNYLLKPDGSGSAFYPVNLLVKRELQWFSWEAIVEAHKHLDKERLTVFIANLPKNVGKTFGMIRETNRLALQVVDDMKRGITTMSMFGVMFRSREIRYERQSEINNDEQYNWYIAGSKVYYKGTKMEDGSIEDEDVLVGTTICFNTMGNASGAQYVGHYNLFYDEYRSKISLPPQKRKKEFDNGVVFLSNFQRGKTGVTFYLFGNNEPGADHLMEGLGIDKGTDYFIDYERGVFYFNVPEAFSGLPVEDNVATKGAADTEALSDFLVHNKAIETDKGIIDKAKFKEAIPGGFLLHSGVFYKLYMNVDKTRWLVEMIEERAGQKQKGGMVTLGFTTSDVCFSPYVSVASIDFVRFLMTQYRFDLISFWQVAARDNFVRIWTEGMSVNFYRTELEKTLN